MMNDPEEKYWSTQNKIYDNLNIEPKLKYLEWQPARWSANAGAIKNILNEIDDIKTVCEVGAGSAAFSLELYRQNKNLKLTAVDRSITACKYAKKIAKDMNIPLTYLIQDLFYMDEEKKYDLVLSLGVIEHFTTAKQIKFIKKCIRLSNKYILIAIPNQNSVIFQSYVNWSQKNGNKYGENHKCLDINELINLVKQCELDLIIVDGFQLYLSESDFWGQVNKEYKKNIEKLKSALLKENWNIGQKFPNYDFSAKDVTDMMNAELSFSREERLKISFMTYVLCKKNE